MKNLEILKPYQTKASMENVKVEIIKAFTPNCRTEVELKALRNLERWIQKQLDKGTAPEKLYNNIQLSCWEDKCLQMHDGKTIFKYFIYEKNL